MGFENKPYKANLLCVKTRSPTEFTFPVTVRLSEIANLTHKIKLMRSLRYKLITMLSHFSEYYQPRISR